MAFMLTDNRILDDNGRPLSGGKVYVYEAGTTTPIDSFPTAAAANAGTPVNSNPVILNAAGIARIYGKDDVVYKVVIKDRDDTTIETIDNISLNGGESAAAAASAALAASASASSAASSASAAESSASSAAGSAEAASESAIAAQASANLATPTVVNFTGDGSTTDFELPYAAGKNSTNVFVSGQYQGKGAYTIVSGTTLRFLVAPANGVNIEVNLAATSTMVSGDTTQVNYNNGASGAVTRNVRDKLRENPSVEDFVSLADAIAYAVSAGVAISVPPGTTVNIPSDAATLQQAIDHIERRGTKGVVTLNLESGYEIPSGLYLADGDYSHFHIVAEDPVVYVTTDFPTDQDVFSGERCVMPVLGCLVDGRNRCDRGFSVWFNSSAEIESNCGVINSGRLGLYAAHNSRVYAKQTDWSGAGDRCIWATRQSQVDAEYVTMNNSGGVNNQNGDSRVVYASRNSLVNISEGSIDTCAHIALDAQRSRIIAVRTTIQNVGTVGINISTGSTVVFAEGQMVNTGSHGILVLAGGYVGAESALIDGAGSDGINARDGGVVAARSVTITGAGRYGLNAESGSTIAAHGAQITGSVQYNIRATEGSRVIARNATCTGGGTLDCRVFLGSQILATGMTTTNGAGTPNFSDIGGASAANTWTADGVVWV